MAGSEDAPAGDDYFNDLSQQPQAPNGGDNSNENVPKPKRVACVLCRKRKLKCDGQKPACATCNRLQHDCVYDEVRRKSGPKRGYVKALESRLAQVETMLKTQEEGPGARKPDGVGGDRRSAHSAAPAVQDGGMVPEFSHGDVGANNVLMLPDLEQTMSGFGTSTQAQYGNIPLEASGPSGDMEIPNGEHFPWEMIGLGLDEPLPTQDVVDELNQAYFDKIDPSLPMIHRPRYYAAMNLAPYARPPVCLRYAMWASAAAVTDKYEALHEHFYQRSRKYIQHDEMKGHGESIMTVAHCQTWALLATYEFKLMFFPRAWMSAGRASRLGLMMGLHRLDGTGLDVKQCLPPPRDWTESEERRRTFWMCFCVDRYASIGTGWPMVIEEKDIASLLPSSEESYLMNRPQNAITLPEALGSDGPSQLSSFAGVVLLSALFGRNLTHLHRPSPDDNEGDLNGEFWKRHRYLDNVLLNTSLSLPDSLRLPFRLNDPNVVFMNMNIHTSTICLHQAAIFKAERHRLPSKVSQESKLRCITAASEIASIMRQVSHIDCSIMNPFISFCLYVAARVFVQYLKPRPNDTQVRASLQFLLSAMRALKRKNPLTESFLVQLDVDLEGAGLDSARLQRGQNQHTAVPSQSPGCPHELLLDLTATTGKCIPTYGDTGLSQYSDPNSSPAVKPASDAADGRYGHKTAEPTTTTSPPLELPNRQKERFSSHFFRNRAQAEVYVDMDVSPSNSSERRTPSSTTASQQNNNNASSHTSQTGYSPAPQNPQITTGDSYSGGAGNPSSLFAANIHAFDTDFDMLSYPASAPEGQPAASGLLPSGWSAGGVGGTGLTPRATTGMTPGSEFMNMNVNMNMTDAEWNQVIEGMAGWGEAG